MDLILVSVLALAFYFAMVLWMLWDAVRRGRGWVRWQVLLYFLSIVAVPIWLVRRRRWPVTVQIGRMRLLKLAGLAAGIVAATLTLTPVLTDAVTTSDN